MGLKIVMNKTWKDTITGSVQQIIKKHRFLKLPLSLYLFLMILLYDVVFYFANNAKRFGSVFAVFLFFFISSSFSFAGFEEYANADSQEWDEIQENYDYKPTVLEITDDDIINDDEILTGFDNEAITVNTDDNMDLFSLDDILSANEMAAGQAEVQAPVNNLSKDDWQLVLVNKQHPIPDDYEFTLGTITGNMKCDVRIIDDLMSMLHAAKEEGVDLLICSPYRDYSRQTMLFNRKIDYYMNKGYSYMEAYKISSITVTVPGASEHSIGLAIDIASKSYPYLEIEFGDTDAGKWLAKHCCEYGFILRYPKGREHITGIQYEPWHFRYVGKEAATEITERGITLEEFVEELN